MGNEPYVIDVDPDSEPGRALDNGSREVVLICGEKRFQVSRGPVGRRGNYDPEAFHRALLKIAGTITPAEAERRKEELYRWREEGSRPPTRP